MPAGLFESLLPAGLGAFGYKEVMDDVGQQRENTADTLAGLTSQAQAGTQFQPWGVTSNLGNTQGTASGVEFGLGDQQQMMQDQLFGGASGMFGKTMEDRGAREADIMQRYEAMVAPGQQRDQQQMDQRLFSTGRTGIASNQGGGGSPEQFALNQAQEEARMRAAFGAMGQANQEQLQNANIGSQMFQNAYRPQQNLLQQAQFGMQNQGMGQVGQLEQAGLMAQLGLGGLTADQNYSNIMGNAFGNMVTAGMPVMAGLGGALDTAIGGGGGGLFDLLKGAGGFNVNDFSTADLTSGNF